MAGLVLYKAGTICANSFFSTSQANILPKNLIQFENKNCLNALNHKSVYIMLKLICTISVFWMVTKSVLSQPGCDLGREMNYTTAINAKLCEEGGHPKDVARDFFDCYDQDITPEGNTFVICQIEAYGFLLNNERNIDDACAAPPDMFQRYGGCIMANLSSPCETMNALNNCQGAVVGVERTK